MPRKVPSQEFGVGLPDGPIEHNGQELVPAKIYLALVDKKARKAVEEIIQDYSFDQQHFMLVRHHYRTDAEAGIACGLQKETPAVWKARDTQFAYDLLLVMGKLADLELVRTRIKIEILIKKGTDEAEKLLDMDWEGMPDRLAQVKGRLISDLWRAGGFLKGNSINIYNDNRRQDGPVIDFTRLAREVREAQERGVLDRDGNVIEGEARILPD